MLRERPQESFEHHKIGLGEVLLALPHLSHRPLRKCIGVLVILRSFYIPRMDIPRLSKRHLFMHSLKPSTPFLTGTVEPGDYLRLFISVHWEFWRDRFSTFLNIS